MDLVLHTPSDNYQIHRTPFFRRLHRINPDQFERLKIAYENIRSFDEKPLQMQVKKVRLEKLYQRIKESLPIAKPGAEKRHQQPKPKTKQQIRCEELAKARQLGNEYSRQKYNSTPRLSEQKKSIREEVMMMKKSNLNRRLDYGNKKSEDNRSKTKRTQAMYLSDCKGRFSIFSRAKTSAVRENLRKYLVYYLSEDKPDPDIVNSFKEIAETQNHLYWDLMEAIKKQEHYIKRYGKFIKNLSRFALKNVEQLQHSNAEVFQSKTNIKRCGSEILIRTYRYSDEDEYLPPPSESLLRIPSDLPDDDIDEIPTLDVLNKSMQELEECSSITHLHLTLPNPPSNTKLLEQIEPENRWDLSTKFGEIIRKTVRRESAIMLINLEKAMKH